MFLQTAASLEDLALGGLATGGLLALIAAYLAVVSIAMAAVYVYISFAFMAIAKKVKYPNPAFAWIPIVGPLLIIQKTSKMHWWPLLLLVVMFIPFIGGVASVVLLVFSLIWLWKTFEKMKKPGWWAILMLIPVVNLVIIGVAAWSK